MKVIVAGFPKTGTKSMQAALKILGYSVYDYMENLVHLEKEWNEICDVGGSTELFRQMYENVDAVTDIPGSVFWDEILKAFPKAKIVFMIRENEDDWFNSFRRQINATDTISTRVMSFLSPTYRRLSRTLRKIAIYGLGHDTDEKVRVNPTICKMHYRRHNAHVLQNAPKDQLLIFNVKEGWDPLCQFLGLPTPDKPFPHKNKGGEHFGEMLQKDPVFIRMFREMIVSLGVFGVFGVVGLCKGVKMANRVNWAGKTTILWETFCTKLFG